MRAGAFACAVAPLKFSALAKPINLPVLWQRCDRFATAPLQLRQMAHPLREMKAQSGDDCVDPSPTLSAPALMIALGACRARWGLRLRAHGTGDSGSSNRGERGSVMEFKKFVPACVGAALSLAVAAFGSGASAADMQRSRPHRPGTGVRAGRSRLRRSFVQERLHHAARSSGDQHRSRPRRLWAVYVLDVYKDKNGFINNVSFYGGVWNDLWSQRGNPTAGSWNEFDWFVGISVKFAKDWKFGVEYIEFIQSAGELADQRNFEFQPRLRGTTTAEILGSRFNPYVKLFYAASGSSTVVTGARRAIPSTWR